MLVLPASFDAPDAAHAFHFTGVEPRRSDANWSRANATQGELTYSLWTQPDPNVANATYVVQGGAKGVALEAVHPQFEAVVRSFRPAGRAPAVPVPAEEMSAQALQLVRDKLVTTGLVIDGAIVMLLVVGLVVARRRLPRLVVAAAHVSR